MDANGTVHQGHDAYVELRELQRELALMGTEVSHSARALAPLRDEAAAAVFDLLFALVGTQAVVTFLFRRD